MPAAHYPDQLAQLQFFDRPICLFGSFWWINSLIKNPVKPSQPSKNWSRLNDRPTDILHCSEHNKKSAKGKVTVSCSPFIQIKRISLKIIFKQRTGMYIWINSVLFLSLDPDIDPSWYTGRGIRPVGRFGRRGTAWEDAQKFVYRPLGQTCIPIDDSLELSDDN